MIPLTEGQGGGKKNASTFDHLFILRSIIAISLKQKREAFITFYDVSKAYDNVDNKDLLTVMWEKGLRGKTWRLLWNMNKELKAEINTKYGKTREVDMETGGRQGSSVTGRMFATSMDGLSEEIINADEGIPLSTELTIGGLLWIDDVVTCVEGEENQENMLKRVDTFGKNHKMKWGQKKCKVMRLGKQVGRADWNLGEMKISTCESYTYLGDEITSDGKNSKNIEKRRNKMKGTAVSINTIAASEVLHKIETAVLLKLHESVSIPTLLANCESWTILKCEEIELDKAEIQSIKSLFDLPTKTPTPGILFSLGLPYTKFRFIQKKVIYLHRILQRNPSHWTRKTLKVLEELNIGWYKDIKKTLNDVQLTDDFDQIGRYRPIEWKNMVKEAIEKKNKETLIEECFKKQEGEKVIKTKTAKIIEQLKNPAYKRGPQKELLHLTKKETKILIISRYGMLECGRNFQGTIQKLCKTCNILDDEEHRLNACIQFSRINYLTHPDKLPFESVFSDDVNTLQSIIARISCVWNVRDGHGTMHR